MSYFHKSEVTSKVHYPTQRFLKKLMYQPEEEVILVFAFRLFRAIFGRHLVVGLRLRCVDCRRFSVEKRNSRNRIRRYLLARRCCRRRSRFEVIQSTFKGNDQEIKFHEIKIGIFQLFAKLIMRSKLTFFRRSKRP